MSLPGELPEAQARALAEARCGDPFAVLGLHAAGKVHVLRVFLPGARAVRAMLADGNTLVLQAAHTPGLFVGPLPRAQPYRLLIDWPGATQETEDPYAFGALLDERDLAQFAQGLHAQLAQVLGAHAVEIGGVPGVRFAVWAPEARRVSVVGDFNSWDTRRHPMRLRHGAGVWELFVPGVAAGSAYKFDLLGAQGALPQKSDPCAQQMEPAPGTASIVTAPSAHVWRDEGWMRARAQRQRPDAPLSIYEVHAASWRRPDGRALRWPELGEQLIPYVRELGFTHIELLPISAHPFNGSWGYQPLGLYAPQPSLGTPEELRAFVDACHTAELGVILDWVPAHFPTDAHGLSRFDGSALYEHADPREGFHPDWNTALYNLGRREVQAHIIGSALHFLESFHIDGLRVDAVASMLYRDYSRREGEWIPNRDGGRENHESIAFLRAFNSAVHALRPDAITIAEESTAWPGVTRAVGEGGLGFDYKWNMGWMHDTLHYMERDPVHRTYAHGNITFGLHYAFSERYVLPISHDEVVHGKRSLFGRMPGDAWQRHASLRAYLAFMWAHPGKKLLFMGGEIAQAREWNHDGELDWAALADGAPESAQRRGLHALLRQLNQAYTSLPALHARDASAEGFEWIVGDDAAQSVFVFARRAPDSPPLVTVCNFTPVVRQNYCFGAPRAGAWREILNTDALDYGGSGVGNAGQVQTRAQPAHGHAHSLSLTLPPLAVLWLQAQDRRHG